MSRNMIRPHRSCVVLFMAFMMASSPLWASDIVLLPVSNASMLLRQCSRSVPATSSGSWTPNVAIVNEIANEITRSPILKSPELQDIAQYNFQAVGIIVNNRKVIYLNGVEKSAWSRTDPSKPIMACDGGNTFFGVVYDPSSKSFSHLSINGPHW